MNREVRTVRPFRTQPEFEWALENSRMRMGSETCFPDSKIIVAAQDEFLRTKPELIWAETEEEFTEFKEIIRLGIEYSNINSDALDLLATAYTSYLKITDIFFRHRLSDLNSLPRSLDLSGARRPNALQASTHGTVVTVYIVLRCDQSPEPLKPWRKGTWLAKCTFRIETDSFSSMFRPIPLDDETRQRYQLGKETARYFNIGDHDPFAPFEDTDTPEFYVDVDLLARIDREASSPIARTLQTILVADVIAGIIAACISRPDDLQKATWEDTKDSILGRIIGLIAGSRAANADYEELLSMAKTDPSRLIARAEGAIGLRKSLLNSMSETI